MESGLIDHCEKCTWDFKRNKRGREWEIGRKGAKGKKKHTHTRGDIHKLIDAYKDP